ncbi:MAG: ribonucleotide-diphosphate reductase subunit beta [Alphaproteobacteria bacterium]|nr:ribonucleotide-diphosphate reductase subunit beta [Alphaproteobacteria bacterium]
MSLLDAKPIYKPFSYPWAYEAWETQQKIHWLPEEVALADDVKDWNHKLTPGEQNLLSQIFRFFTQSDIEVNNCYMKHYSRIFKPTEIQMMLAAFSNMETIHIAAYSYLLDTIGMPEAEYQAFLRYKEMKDKYDYMQSFNMNSKRDIAITLAVFGGFTEGLQLFASFAILLNFPRFNKMKGMGQIVTWSVRDESLHTNSIIRLFKTFVLENPEIWDDALRQDLYNACETIVHHEDSFIDLAFEMGDVHGLSADEVKQYIRYIGDRRLLQLGLNPLFGVKENPLPWLDEILNGVEHTNFFENRVTEYSKAATRGSWDEVFTAIDAPELKLEVA